MWSIAVVRRTCRVIDIASLAPAQNLENLPRTTSGLARLPIHVAESTSASKFGNGPSAWDKPLPVTSFFINK